VVDRDMSIEALKKEVEMVEAEKSRLANKVAGLRSTQSNIEDLKEKVESLSKALEGAKATEQLAAERALKASDTAENLHKEVAVERESAWP
jgi:archaellum component FlaC